MPITKKQELSNVPISKLIPYTKNPRKNDAAVKQVAKSLEEFGLVKNSIVVDEDMVLITGHTTTKAMQTLGWENAPEVTQVFGLTAAQKQAYRIADNKLGELAEWDTELLGLELEELRGLDFDIELTGFDEEEFDKLLQDIDILNETETPQGISVKDTFEIIVECKDETEQEKTYNELIEGGYTCRVLTL